MKYFSKILISITCFTILFSFGAMIGSLSAAIPELADTFNEPESKVGELFTARGVGYAIGAVSTGALLNYNVINITSELFFSFIVITFGVTIGFIAQSSNIGIMMVLVLFNAICMGYFDTFCCFWLSEIWGVDVGPWMQALFAVMGLGQVTGPTLVGFFGYKIAFTIIAASCSLPLLGIVTKDTIGEFFEENSNQKFQPIVNADSNIAVINNSQSIVVYQENNSEGALCVDAEENVDPETNVIKGNSNQENIDVDNQAKHEGLDGECIGEQDSNLLHVPTIVKYLLFFYYMFYLGMEIVFSGWVGSFALDAGLTNSESKAAYLVSILYMASTLSRISAVPLHVHLSNKHILLLSLTIASLGSVFIVIFAKQSYMLTAIGSVMLGLGFGPIFSVGMTIPIDYGCCTLDSNTVAICILGGAAGDAVLPVVVGIIMNSVGYMGLPFSVLVLMCILWCICISIHVLLTYQHTQFISAQKENIVIEMEKQSNTVSVNEEL